MMSLILCPTSRLSIASFITSVQPLNVAYNQIARTTHHQNGWKIKLIYHTKNVRLFFFKLFRAKYDQNKYKHIKAKKLAHLIGTIIVDYLKS